MIQLSELVQGLPDHAPNNTPAIIAMLSDSIIKRHFTGDCKARHLNDSFLESGRAGCARQVDYGRKPLELGSAEFDSLGIWLRKAREKMINADTVHGSTRGHGLRAKCFTKLIRQNASRNAYLRRPVQLAELIDG